MGGGIFLNLYIFFIFQGGGWDGGAIFSNHLRNSDLVVKANKMISTHNPVVSFPRVQDMHKRNKKNWEGVGRGAM